MKIYFSGARLSEKKVLSNVLQYAADNLYQPDKMSVSVAFLNEKEIRRLNKESRDIDKVTDVLSYQYLDYLNPGEKVDVERAEYIDVLTGLVDLGEIYICRAVARSQAKSYGHSLKRETAFLALHGFLHLLGYNHDNEEDEREMFALQEKFLAALNINRS